MAIPSNATDLWLGYTERFSDYQLPNTEPHCGCD
jgi:hypothetical protein